MKLSIIIPAYNVEKTLENCVESIISQGIQNYEILIVNDGSTDQTLSHCDKLENKYGVVKVITQANSGVSVARNTGIKHASGEWIMFVDGDDALQSESLKRIDFDTKEDFLVFGYRKILLDAPSQVEPVIVHESAKTLQKVILNKAGYPDYLKKVRVLDSTSCWTCWGKAFRRELILKGNIEFPLGVTHGEDLIFVYRYCEMVENVLFMDFPVYYYRITQNSVAHRFNPRRLENTEILIKTLENEPGVKGTEDFNYFVFDRLYICCKLFFGKENAGMTKEQKITGLKELCNEEYYKKSLSVSAMKQLSNGKKTRLKKWCILQLLKKERYANVIALYNDDSLWSRIFIK